MWQWDWIHTYPWITPVPSNTWSVAYGLKNLGTLVIFGFFTNKITKFKLQQVPIVFSFKISELRLTNSNLCSFPNWFLIFMYSQHFVLICTINAATWLPMLYIYGTYVYVYICLLHPPCGDQPEKEEVQGQPQSKGQACPQMLMPHASRCLSD